MGDTNENKTILTDKIKTWINEIITLVDADSSYGTSSSGFNNKKASSVIVNHSATVGRNSLNDNAIPMETVTIQSFRREKSAEVENPIIHRSYADEFARSQQ